MELDYYGILGVRPDASTDDIKAAYRRLVRRFHPDSNPRNPGATIQFHAISEAHETLIDPGRRRIYDESLMRRRSRLAAGSTGGLYSGGNCAGCVYFFGWAAPRNQPEYCLGA
jgi:molecular chaperone DnaJ